MYFTGSVNYLLQKQCKLYSLRFKKLKFLYLYNSVFEAQIRLMEKADFILWQQMVHNYVHNRISTRGVFDQPALRLLEA